MEAAPGRPDSAAHCFRSRTPEQTRALGAALTRILGEGEGVVVDLRGDLGAGKTVFVKGLAEGLDLAAGEVSSPTYVILNHYVGRCGLSLHHADFYRLERADELEFLGFFDVLDGRGVVAVEWADRHPEAMPRDRLVVRITATAGAARGPGDLEAESAGPRTIEVTALGPGSRMVLERWRMAASERV